MSNNHPGKRKVPLRKARKALATPSTDFDSEDSIEDVDFGKRKRNIQKLTTKDESCEVSSSSQSCHETQKPSSSIFDVPSEEKLQNVESTVEIPDEIDSSLIDKNIRTVSLSEDSSSSSSDDCVYTPFSIAKLNEIQSVTTISLSKSRKSDKSNVNQREHQEQTDAGPSEYYDFSKIIKTQEELKNLEVKLNTLKSEGNNKSCFLLDDDDDDDDNDDDKKDDFDKFSVSKILELGEKGCENEADAIQKNEPPDDRTAGTKNIEITIQLPNLSSKSKQTNNIEAAVKRHYNEKRKIYQEILHKVHLLCLLGHGFFLNRIINSEELLGACMSLLPSDKFYPPSTVRESYIQQLLKWFHNKIKINRDKKVATEGSLHDLLMDQIQKLETNSYKNFTILFICLVRSVGLYCRLVISLQPFSIKPPSSDIMKSVSKKEVKKSDEEDEEDDRDFEEVTQMEEVTQIRDNTEKSPRKGKKKEVNKSLGALKNNVDSGKKKNKKLQGKKTISVDTKCKTSNKLETNKQTENSKTKSKKTSPTKCTSSSKKLDRRVLSSDEEAAQGKKKNKPKREGIDFWAEVYLEADRKWITVDVLRNAVDSVQNISLGCTRPIIYVISWDNDNKIKDITKRYAPQWLTATQKLRVAVSWWTKAISPWAPKNTKRERDENKELEEIIEETPLPTKISDYKGHPHYALKRHLLKFEAIFPDNAVPIGYIRGEPVYARICVSQLHARETWIRQGKVVRLKEEPYKIVKARPKLNKMTGQIVKDLPLQLFGYWQVDDYIPPPAVDGKVPRNEYGNVELYKPTMLPKGTVHLQVPGVLRVARKLDIDCAPAVVGWEFHGGSSHPIIDGVIVCEEFQETLLDAWNKEIDNSAKRSKEKSYKRARKNWRKLIRSVILRSRLKRKYNFKF